MAHFGLDADGVDEGAGLGVCDRRAGDGGGVLHTDVEITQLFMVLQHEIGLARAVKVLPWLATCMPHAFSVYPLWPAPHKLLQLRGWAILTRAWSRHSIYTEAVHV